VQRSERAPAETGPGGKIGVLQLDQVGASDGLEGQDGAGDKGRLLLEHRVVDRRAKTFVQDLDAKQFRRGGGPVFVGGGDRDIEGQALVGVPGQSRFLEALDGRQRNVVKLFRGGVHGQGNIAIGRRAEGAGAVGGELVGDLELGTDLSWGAPLALNASMRYICIYSYIASRELNAPPAFRGRERRNHETSMEGVKRMSLIIPPDLHRAFKVAAAAEGREMTELILEFIEDYVQRHAPVGMLKKKSQQKRVRS